MLLIFLDITLFLRTDYIVLNGELTTKPIEDVNIS
jgi:hypothetical protein